MKRIRGLVRPFLIILGCAGVLVMLGFVERKSDRTVVRELDVHVKGVEGVHFIDEADIQREILDQGVAVIGRAIEELDLPAIEERLRLLPPVRDVQVYYTLDGLMHVKVVQREPIVRIIHADGTGSYLDREGWTFPTSTEHTARVMVVTGMPKEAMGTDHVRQVYTVDSLVASSLCDELHGLALFIHDDPFLRALIDQVHVNAEREFELYPTVGGHRILIGDGSRLEERFAKLKVFYEQGIPQSDWRRHATLDLRFTDQIVTTKRTTP